MLKFAVVHSPIGPTKGPGLDHTDQSPGVEERHMYVGPGVFDWMKPYDQKGDGNLRQERDKPKERGYDISKKKIEEKKDKDRKKSHIVAIDFDGTITAGPHTFKSIIARIVQDGGTAHLVTGRPYTDKKEVLDYCSVRGLKFSSTNFFPFRYTMESFRWDTLLETRIAAWKATILRQINAGILFDDNRTVIETISKSLPEVTIFTPVGGK